MFLSFCILGPDASGACRRLAEQVALEPVTALSHYGHYITYFVPWQVPGAIF